MLVSGIGTLLILPALARFFESALFKVPAAGGGFCNPVSCISILIIAIISITYGIHQFGVAGWTPLVWGVVAGLFATAIGCHLASKTEICNPG